MVLSKISKIFYSPIFLTLGFLIKPKLPSYASQPLPLLSLI